MRASVERATTHENVVQLPRANQPAARTGLGRYDHMRRYADGLVYLHRNVTPGTLTTCAFCFRSYEQREIVVGAFSASARICAPCAGEALAVFEATTN